MTSLSDILRSSTLSMALILTACSHTPEQPSEKASSVSADSHLSTHQREAVTEAKALANRGDYSSARNTLERLLEQQPRHPELWANLAALYYQMAEPEAFTQALKRARQLEPDNAQVLNLEGTLALEEGHVDAAKERFTRALKSEPEHPEVHYNLALLYDTYYQNLRRAVLHYQAYLQFNTEPDEATADWLKQLERALERQNSEEQEG